MDFFDPEKQKQHAIRLAIGYALIGIVLVLATTILLYRAYGFGLDRNGNVIQNGLVFVSSRPAGATLYLSGKKYKSATNTRANLPAGQYTMQLHRDGYLDWRRALTVEGGSVERFDYPMLFPTKLTTTITKQYLAAPGVTSESLDRHWLLVAAPNQNVFDLYDLSAKKLVAQQLTVSDEILAAGTTTTGWQTVEWAKDNRHVVLRRTYQKLGQPGTEYILLDRQDVTQSQNLSVTLGFTPTSLELHSQNYDQYYLFDQNSGQVFSATLKKPTPQPIATGVLAFSSEGDVVTYVTTLDAPAGKVLIRIQKGNDPALTIRQAPVSTIYVLDMATYSGSLYLAVGSSTENKVFVYKDPIGQLQSTPKEPAVPIHLLKVDGPTYVSFSANKRFVIAENSDHFAVYDAETDRGFVYQAKAALDAPQLHATWMDGFRLSYVSGGAVVAFDYDGTNTHSLSAASPALLPIFDQDYRYLYTVSQQNALTSTALLAPNDL